MVRLTSVANTSLRFSFTLELLCHGFLTLCVTAIHCQALPLVDSTELNMTLALRKLGSVK